MTFRQAIYRTLVIILFFFLAAEGFAAIFPTTEDEFARLPAYCKARLGPTHVNVSESEIQKWKQALGPGFLHVHHFCAGLNTLNTLNRGVPNTNQLSSVLKDFEYTQKHASKDFPLQPKISVEKGRLLLRMNRTKEAVSEFRMAIKLNPSYTPPYAELSDYYVKIGLPDRAESILKEGLKHSPNSKGLKRRLDKL